jgi:hypothetical protein
MLNGEVIVEEKIDGSQFSFCKINGQLYCRSKGVQLVMSDPDKLFASAVSSVIARGDLLREGVVYRGEVLCKPCHNSLSYDRVPNGNIIVFDIMDGLENYLSRAEKEAEAARIGLECVPILFEGTIESLDAFVKMLDTVSCLGGAKIEGVVIKPRKYDAFGQDKKVLMAKFVSEAFKEVHRRTFPGGNPNKSDVVAMIGEQYRTHARWEKALIHLREAGKIQDSPRDIELLMKEIPADVFKECEGEMKDQIWNWARPHIKRLIVRGVAEWYKAKLLDMQFPQQEADGGRSAAVEARSE